MSHNRDLSAAAAQIGFHSSNIGIGTDVPSETITLNHANGASIGLEYDGTENGTINVNSAAMYVRAGTGKLLILGSNATERLRIDSNGNLGVNKTPETDWSGSYRAIEIGNSSVSGYQGNTYPSIELNMNCRGTAASYSSGWKYIRSMVATQIHMPYDGNVLFRRAASGSADGDITWSESMRITSGGNIGINDSGPNFHLDVDGNIGVREGQVLTWHDGSGNKAGDIYMDSSDNFIIRNTSSVAERLRITSDGKMGLGISSPARGGLHIHKAATAELHLTDDTTGSGSGDGFTLFSTSSSAGVWYRENAPLRFATYNTERVRISSGGNVGINEAAPDRQLHVKSGANSNDGVIRIESSNDNIMDVGTDGTGHFLNCVNTDPFRIKFAGTERLHITSDGDLGVNILDPQEKLHVHIAKSAGTTGTTRTKQHAAMRLSLNRNGGSPPYYGWGPALDFYSDNYDGTTQRPNARIAGVISNSSVDQEGGQLRFYTTANDTATSESDFTERMRIYADGIVTTTYQPAFNAKLSTATGANHSGMLVFNTTDHNQGGHYSTSNGRFTAPLAGKYLFNFYTNVFRDGGTGSLWADWYVNNSAKGFRMYTQYSGGWELVGGSIVLSLNQNDYVQVWAGTSGNWDGGSYGSFNGYLLG